MDWLWFIWYIYTHTYSMYIYMWTMDSLSLSTCCWAPEFAEEFSPVKRVSRLLFSAASSWSSVLVWKKNRRRLSQAMAVDCEFYLFTSVLKHSYLESLLVPSHRLRRASISSAPFHSHARAHQHWEALSGEVLHCCLDDCLHRFWCRGCLEVQALALGRPQEQSAWSVYSSLAPAIGCGLVPMWTALQDMTCICGGFSIPPKSWLHGQASHL